MFDTHKTITRGSHFWQPAAALLAGRPKYMALIALSGSSSSSSFLSVWHAKFSSVIELALSFFRPTSFAASIAPSSFFRRRTKKKSYSSETERPGRACVPTLYVHTRWLHGSFLSMTNVNVASFSSSTCA